MWSLAFNMLALWKEFLVIIFTPPSLPKCSHEIGHQTAWKLQRASRTVQHQTPDTRANITHLGAAGWQVEIYARLFVHMYSSSTLLCVCVFLLWCPGSVSHFSAAFACLRLCIWRYIHTQTQPHTCFMGTTSTHVQTAGCNLLYYSFQLKATRCTQMHTPLISPFSESCRTEAESISETDPLCNICTCARYFVECLLFMQQLSSSHSEALSFARARRPLRD